jgi:protease-4
MSRSVLVASLVLLSVACWSGCKGPVSVFTCSKLKLDGPVSARVKVDLPAVPELGPLTEVPVRATAGPRCHGKIALVDVDGLLLNANLTGLGSLGENPVSAFREKLDRAAEDPDVRAVVLRINSPGGAVTAADVMWHDLVTFRREKQVPVVASLVDVGAGGAYYVAAGADRIVAHPTSIVGGIGVVLNLYNLSDSMAMLNVLDQRVKAGPDIDLGNVTQSLTPANEALLQAMADEFHQRFKEVVVQSRPDIDPSDESTLGGRVFIAGEAQRRGLVDQVGYLDDAIAAAAELAGSGNLRVVSYRRHGNVPATGYDIAPNRPLERGLIPFSIPGLDRSRLPTFMYVWSPDPTLAAIP